MKKNYLYGNSDYLLSYSKICGRKIKDIVGYISTEYDEPTFKISRIILEDGYELGVEGEHDFPYIVDYDEKTAKILDDINEEEKEEE